MKKLSVGSVKHSIRKQQKTNREMKLGASNSIHINGIDLLLGLQSLLAGIILISVFTIPESLWFVRGLVLYVKRKRFKRKTQVCFLNSLYHDFRSGNCYNSTMDTKEQPILAFSSAKSWEEWLDENHNNSSGIWLRFFKKTSEITSISHNEALDVALCYGWIDGQLKKYDEKSWLRKFTPRRPRSLWSNRNKEHAEGLIISGKMQPAGLREVNEAKEDGRWIAAYDSYGKMDVPQDFLEELNKDDRAKSFFVTLDKANVYAIAWRLQTAKKPETRRRRLETIIEMLAKGEKFHD